VEASRCGQVAGLEEIVGVSAGLRPLIFDARALGLLLPREVERDVAEPRDVLGGMTGTDATLILMEGDIERPMHPVLNSPATADLLAEGGGEVNAVLRWA